MRGLLLLALLCGLGGYLWYQQQRSYGLPAIVTPAGVRFRATTLPDDCSLRGGACMKRMVYLSAAVDTVAIKAEIEQLLPWASVKVPAGQIDQALVVVALKPGFLNMGAPRQLTGLAYDRRAGSSRWQYLGLQDMSERLAPLFH